MIDLDAASVLLQWATGGLFFCWITTRRREVSLGYGWTLRGTYFLMALGAAYVGIFVIDPLPVRDIASVGVACWPPGWPWPRRSSAARPGCPVRSRWPSRARPGSRP